MRGYSDGGFYADGELPHQDRPQNWYIWHFTHIDNLESIARMGGLRSDSAGLCRTDVASVSVKSTRRERIVAPAAGIYPSGLAVSDHVPWYIAAKSPMLYCVCNGYKVPHQGGPDPLVFLGVRLADLWASGMTWCCSDRNAAVEYAQFSVVASDLGRFVDFDLLRQRFWNDTPDDGDRAARRAAEVLVPHAVPLSLVSVAVTRSGARMREVRAILDRVSGSRQYVVKPELYYDRKEER